MGGWGGVGAMEARGRVECGDNSRVSASEAARPWLWLVCWTVCEVRQLIAETGPVDERTL